MRNTRNALLHWVELGLIRAPDLSRALASVDALPTIVHWHQFIERILLWLGGLMLAIGLGFFFAYNWGELGRLAKFALIELPLLGSVLLVWHLGLERATGKLALTTAALLVGVLFGLIGQVYQTGADTFELFTAWAVAILPLVWVGRCSVLWLIWLTLVNLSVLLYFSTFTLWFGILFGPRSMLWLAFAVNGLALLAWELAAAAGVTWLRPRWGARVVFTAVATVITSLAVVAVIDWHDGSVLSLVVWLSGLGAGYLIYRIRRPDLYMLAGGVLSATVVIATALGRLVLETDAIAGGLLLVGLVVIAMSSAGAWWLKRLASGAADRER